MIPVSFKKYSFSLIELLIVIGIMGALAALILPAFSDSESAAKNTACAYNQAGTLRYLNMFHSSNGVYPAGFHTGGSNTDWNTSSSKDNSVNLTPIAAHNFSKASENLSLNEKKHADSLIEAGIVILSCGQNNNTEFINLGKDRNITVKAITPGEINASSWTNELDPVTGEVKTNGTPITFKGVSLGYIAKIGDMDNISSLDEKYKQFRKDTESEFKIVPLYISPAVDWTTYYKDGPKQSKVSVAMTSKCPWGKEGQARYYIAFFKVYADGTPAKLLITGCPDCGILDSNSF